MSNIRVNDFPSRKQYTYAGGLPAVFVVDWPFFEDTDLFVYLSDPADDFEQEDPLNILTLGVDYQVTGAGLHTGGTVTLTVAPTVGWTVTIVGRMPIDRFSIYDSSSVVSMAQLNEDFNRVVVMIKNINTIIEQTIPKYDRSEYVQTTRSNPNTPFSYVNLPMLLTGEVWTGNATNTGLTKAFLGGSGTGNVIAAGPGMRPSIARWTGVDFVLTDSDININGATFEKTAGVTTDRIEIDDAWGAFHWPAHVTGSRPATPQNGDTYYDTTFNQFFGYIGGQWLPFSMGNGASNLWQRIFTQPGHTFVPGDLVYQKTDGDFELLLGTDAEHAEIQGMVVDPDPADPDQFLLQYGGEVDFSTWTSIVPLWAQGMPYGGVFFASTTNAGEGTLVPPTANGQVNLPVFLAFGPLTGVLRHSRGMIVGGTPPISGGTTTPNTVTKTITQTAHGFQEGDWLYVLPYNVGANEVEYALGDSSVLASSHVDGVVIDVIDADHFTLQEGGICDGVINTANNAPGAAITSGDIFYLSNTVPGKLMAAPPITVGHYSVRCFACEQLATDDPGTSIDSGYIMEKLPTRIAAPAGSGAIVLIGTFDYTNVTGINDLVNVLDGTYSDAWFVGRNFVIQRTGPGAPTYLAEGFYFRFAQGGAAQSDNNYRPPQFGVPFAGSRGTAISVIPQRMYSGDYTTLGTPDAPISFEIYLPDCNRANTYKQSMNSMRAWSELVTAPAAAGAPLAVYGLGYLQTGVAAGFQPYGGCYLGAQTPLTGLAFFVDGTGLLPAPTTLLIVSGEISVYGRVA